MDKPKIKPLVWRDALPSANPSYSPNIAPTPFGMYYANAHAFWLEDLEAIKCPSREDAKAAAQADYEARILAALEPVTVQEAAQLLLVRWLSGSFEDSADAVADDAITDQWAHVDRTYPDAAPIIEAWLRALAQKDAE